jgi:hypothetical protein
VSATPIFKSSDHMQPASMVISFRLRCSLNMCPTGTACHAHTARALCCSICCCCCFAQGMWTCPVLQHRRNSPSCSCWRVTKLTLAIKILDETTVSTNLGNNSGACCASRSTDLLGYRPAASRQAGSKTDFAMTSCWSQGMQLRAVAKHWYSHHLSSRVLSGVGEERHRWRECIVNERLVSCVRVADIRRLQV